VARVSRDAYAEAFRRVTGRPLVALPQLPGAGDSEIFFEAAALNPAPNGRVLPPGADGDAGRGAHPGARPQQDADLLSAYTAELAVAFASRRELLASHGRELPGARAALAAVAGLTGTIQSVLTGTIKPNAAEKLRAFDLLPYLDLDIGGFGSDAYPKGALLIRSHQLAERKYGVRLDPAATVYLADSVRDVAAARIAGVRSIGVATGRSTAAELRAAGASLVLTDLADAAAVVAAVGALTAA
jgi:phosphoglycolate phosphatase